MGINDIQSAGSGDTERLAMRAVLRDIDALERMDREGLFEESPRRIGAEQELMLVDGSLHPAPIATEVIERANDPRVVPELARFNVEINCDPIEVGPRCLASLEAQLNQMLRVVSDSATHHGASVLLTGIGPTLDLTHLSTDNIAPHQRYFALDEMLKKLRGADYALHIEGADELLVRHPSVMLEALNTSFQVHYQTTPSEFPAAYNTAMAVAAPVLAASVNSPILFGKRLWRETRIAIFQQVVDTRSQGVGGRVLPARVRFGDRWTESSVLEVFRSDVAKFRQVLASGGAGDADDSCAALDAGRVPKLKALAAFNSSVYRWMRPCFGVTDGRPHLRIENRVLPAGPTVLDEVANAAFWIGLMAEGPVRWTRLHERLEFADARLNFNRAAQHGLSCNLTWLDGEELPVRQLIEHEFVPTARDGLARLGVDAAEIDRTMSVIEQRVGTGKTGARWMLDSVSRMRGWGTQAQRLDCLTRAMLKSQESGRPVHEWEPAERDDDDGIHRAFAVVSQCMSTDLFTVPETECVDLVAAIMDWEHLRHVPVENDEHELVGLLSYRDLLRVLARRSDWPLERPIPVDRIMVRDPITVAPDTPSVDAIRLMSEKKVSCLPVVEDGRLVGIVSERDYSAIARSLLERALRNDDAGERPGHGAVGDA
ncbi:MAG: CBS domain-containing protein [Planctomycetota bacterium]